jgi:carbamoyl-phosphate synthase large subunit
MPERTRRLNILFTSAGRRVALIRCFRESMHRLGMRGRILAGDAKHNAAALFVADEKVSMPLINDPEYIPFLQSFCRDRQIHLVVPLIDPELSQLSRHRDEFSAAGTTLLVSSEATNAISNNKQNTAAFFKEHAIATPRLWSVDELEGHDWKTPLLLKPASGSSSVGVAKIKSLEELRFYWARTQNPIVQTLAQGQEYTIDVLVGEDGKALCAVPRLRIETRSGEISKGVTVKNTQIMEAAKKVAEALPNARGCLTIQCFHSAETGEIQFIEINPRFGGGYPLSYAAGADYPGWILANLTDTPFSISFDGWRDGLSMMRYDAAIFVSQEETK